ncbi:DUF555 family protein [Halalkaliarchaeum sp. AArc-CO]|uniref:DUF555 domain-containing protein n=1 Tax=unclassified Halalkaliarchaeum TaxID=2678344 RepID=UPI00217D95F7|nr:MULTISPECIES: DUF555 domain-containing protein [unclassified Halalkaliarchaeum]MDR5673971.1 DUF555 domain-containing protein [Halalkaliarchaeum sp. AArc-GB]UWG50607.1 DUF555 family protein [Halalkaliarchaeum sp. AArc-CO]
MDCRVVVEAAVPVYDVETPDEAIRIAISKTGEMLNPDLNYVEINMGERTTPDGKSLPPAFIAADEALVALELEMTVFNVEREEHASRIARKEIGQRLRNIPLKVLEVEVIPDEQDEQSGEEGDGNGRTEEGDGSDDPTDSGSDDENGGNGNGDDDLLPEFEEMVDE